MPTVVVTVAHSNPDSQKEETIPGCGWWKGYVHSLNRLTSFSSILVWHFSLYRLQPIYLSPLAPHGPSLSLTEHRYNSSTIINENCTSWVAGRGTPAVTAHPLLTAFGPNHKWPMGNWEGATWLEPGHVFISGCSGLGFCLFFLN